MRLPRAAYIPEPDAVEELMSDEEALAGVKVIADAILKVARDLTPVVTGEHRDAEYASDPYLDGENGARCDVGSTSPTWHLIEYGSVNNPPWRPLTSAAERVGVRFEP